MARAGGSRESTDREYGHHHDGRARPAAGLSCWGDNAYGQLGDPDAGGTVPSPGPVANVADVAVLRAVALGTEHACVAYDGDGASGAVRCWGRGHSGQLGNGATPALQKTGVEVVPESDARLLGVVALAAGGATPAR